MLPRGNSRLSRACKRAAAAAAVAAAAAAATLGSAAPSLASAAAGPQPPGAVSPVPVYGTPHLPATSNPVETVRQIAHCGSTMYAVGSFTQIQQGSSTYTRNNVFSFSAKAPYTITSWAPDVDGVVNSIAFDGSNCADAYIGGDFTSVNGAPVSNLAEISTSTGSVVTRFGSSANSEVDTLLAVRGHLLVGGKFTLVNGSSSDPYFASLDPATGSDDGFLHLSISGRYHYCDPSSGRCTVPFPTQVYNQQLSHDGTRELAEGVFDSVGGKRRKQIFMLDLANSPATVTGWTSPEWDGSKGNLPGGYPYQCWFGEPFYIRAAAWSPDDSTIYLASTGFHPWNVSTSAPRSGLCDSTAAFAATNSPVLHKWINYTGCDSLYTVAADSSAVYVAGHPRWSMNPDGCNKQGPGAVVDAGLQGLNPSNGNTLMDSSTGKALYTMSRANADDMLITPKGLWIASTNRYGSQWCGPRRNHAGICFLPY